MPTIVGVYQCMHVCARVRKRLTILKDKVGNVKGNRRTMVQHKFFYEILEENITSKGF